MSRRYYFQCPDTVGPAGGREFLYRSVKLLRDLGFDARALHSTPGFHYDWIEYDIPIEYLPLPQSYKGKLKSRLKALGSKKSRHNGKELAARMARLNPDDVVVLPETSLWIRHIYHPAKVVIFNQNGFYFAERVADVGDISGDIAGVISTSALNDKAAEILGLGPRATVSYSIEENEFPYRAEKKPQIAYMPRKRGREAGILNRLLETRLASSSFEMKPIDGVSKSEAAEMIGESLIFLSLSEIEGLGLPPAEAMATGSIVIGYTGHGGDEFFTSETGFVVSDGNFLELLSKTEDVIAEYEANPKRLDDFRKRVSDSILTNYSKKASTIAFKRAFEEVESWLE